MSLKNRNSYHSDLWIFSVLYIYIHTFIIIFYEFVQYDKSRDTSRRSRKFLDDSAWVYGKIVGVGLSRKRNLNLYLWQGAILP